METRPTILLADDDAGVARLVDRALEPMGCRFMAVSSGDEALAAAEKSAPDLILLDVEMPRLSGWGVLERLRRSSATRTTPVVMLTGRVGVEDKVEGFNRGADDYVTKPFELEELRARVSGLLRRNRETLSANPLTHLPGSPALQTEVERRIAEGRAFGFLYADIDRFKAFNDAYGYDRGDRAIQAAAQILRRAVEDAGETEGFVGHIGGDDFAVVCSEERAERVAALAVIAFDARAPMLHDPRDASNGFIETVDRRGELRRFPLISLTVGGVTTRRRRPDCYARVAALASEMKACLKARRDCGPSAWAFDRRGDAIRQAAEPR